MLLNLNFAQNTKCEYQYAGQMNLSVVIASIYTSNTHYNAIHHCIFIPLRHTYCVITNEALGNYCDACRGRKCIVFTKKLSDPEEGEVSELSTNWLRTKSNCDVKAKLMQESGVDLEFDILDFIDLEPNEFCEVQSRTLDDVVSKPASGSLETSADEILTEVFNQNKMTSKSRTQQKQQLQREFLLKQEQQKKHEDERRQQSEQSSEVSIPFTRPPETLPPHIPPHLLKFNTRLENPTKYYVYKTQERKLKEYIDHHGNHHPGLASSSSQPTLNAINSGAIGEHFVMSGGMKPPDSPMSAASSAGTSEVDDILDDIISLEGDNTVITPQVGFDFEPFFSLPSAVLPTTKSISDVYGARNITPLTVPVTMSSSAPPTIKQETDEGKYDNVSYLKDRQKKDNHNMIERRRRFNINDRIKELGTIIPRQDSEMKQNKGTILKCTVDYIRQLRKDVDRAKLHQDRYRETEDLNGKLLLRVKELEMHCRAHNVPVTPLTDDTSTATLSSLLTSGSTPRFDIKQERNHDVAVSCSMDEISESSAPDDDSRNSMETS